MADIQITGLAELRSRITNLPGRLVKNALKAGLRQAANIIKDQARQNFGQAGEPNELSGALKNSIRVIARSGTPTRVNFSVTAGSLSAAQQKRFGANSAFYALWVEKGHINRKLGEALRGSHAGRAAARKASTSNTPAHPYMKPALESKAKEALDKLTSVVKDRLPEDVK